MSVKKITTQVIFNLKTCMLWFAVGSWLAASGQNVSSSNFFNFFLLFSQTRGFLNQSRQRLWICYCLYFKCTGKGSHW